MSHHNIPLSVKVACSAFLAVIIPVYWHAYGPTNFLWFCDAALILTVAGMWLESSILISMVIRFLRVRNPYAPIKNSAALMNKIWYSPGSIILFLVYSVRQSQYIQSWQPAIAWR